MQVLGPPPLIKREVFEIDINKINFDNLRQRMTTPIDQFDIRKLILDTSVPFEWCSADRSHPVETLGYFYFGVGDGFRFDKEKVANADELLLWKLYGLIQNYWFLNYQHYLESEKNKY